MKPTIYHLFPTAVASFECDNHSEFKEAFYNQLPEHCIPHENGSGLISGEYTGKVYVHTDEKLVGLFKFVSDCITEYLNQISFDSSRVDINIVKSWISATSRDSTTPVHLHATSHLSFVYYMNIPENADPIAFQITNSPNEPYNSAFGETVGRQKSMVLERNIFNSNRSVINVKEGQLLVFPSNLLHGTIKVGDIEDNQRISLAGDVLLVYNEAAPNYATGLFDPKTWRKFS